VSKLTKPPHLQKDNLYIIVKGNDNVQKEKLYYKSKLVVGVDSNNYLVQIYDSKENPIPLAYVKIYYKTGSSLTFKDGYTDFRGCFRYLDKKEDWGQYEIIKMLAYQEELGYCVHDRK